MSRLGLGGHGFVYFGLVGVGSGWVGPCQVGIYRFESRWAGSGWNGVGSGLCTPGRVRVGWIGYGREVAQVGMCRVGSCTDPT